MLAGLAVPLGTLRLLLIHHYSYIRLATFFVNCMIRGLFHCSFSISLIECVRRLESLSTTLGTHALLL